MAEIATIARPYPAPLSKAAGAQAPALAAEVAALAAVMSEPQLRLFADNPTTTADQVQDIVLSVLGAPVSAQASNFLRTVLDNGRLSALPEIAAQFQALVDARSGISQARIESAYPIDAIQLTDVVATLEQRFGRKLEASVVVRPDLIGGIRVVVGDEVLDTSVKARLEQMKVALTA